MLESIVAELLFGSVLHHINPCRLFNANLYIYMICKYISLITFLNEPKFILLHTIKSFQVMLGITNNSIKHQLFIHTQLNDQIVLFQTV